MSKEQALELLRNVCAQFRGTLADHQNLQTALKTLEAELKAEKPKEKTK